MLKQGLRSSGIYDNEEVEMVVRKLLRTQEPCIYGEGIFKFVRRIDRFINFLGDLAEKL
jgi:hypothetical protein